jgi:hypothetical protein
VCLGQVVLEVLCNLSHQTLEGQLAEQKIRALLVAANLAQGHSSGTVTVRLQKSTHDRQQSG